MNRQGSSAEGLEQRRVENGKHLRDYQGVSGVCEKKLQKLAEEEVTAD